MMNQKTVIITIDENGEATIDLKGFNGKGCAKVAADFAGTDTIKTQIEKQEFFAQETQAQKQVVKS